MSEIIYRKINENELNTEIFSINVLQMLKLKKKRMLLEKKEEN